LEVHVAVAVAEASMYNAGISERSAPKQVPRR
jgi:hypothetical protein